MCGVGQHPWSTGCRCARCHAVAGGMVRCWCVFAPRYSEERRVLQGSALQGGFDSAVQCSKLRFSGVSSLHGICACRPLVTSHQTETSSATEEARLLLARCVQDAAPRRPRRRVQRSRRSCPVAAKHGEQRRQHERTLVQRHPAGRPPAATRHARRPAGAHRQRGVRMRRHRRRVHSAERVAPASRRASRDTTLPERRVRSYVENKACAAGQCRPSDLIGRG